MAWSRPLVLPPLLIWVSTWGRRLGIQQELASPPHATGRSKLCDGCETCSTICGQAPNTLGRIEEGKKAAKKQMDIVIHGLWGPDVASPLHPEVYTASGWPAVSTPVLRQLAGKAGAAKRALLEAEGVPLETVADDGAWLSWGHSVLVWLPATAYWLNACTMPAHETIAANRPLLAHQQPCLATGLTDCRCSIRN